ncbi:MAG: hypothetical protein U9Q73_02290 [Nanoarchaeota archaeon]|nr:hypothetical protein [Nanoarchaeota archaeon]
MEKIRFFSRIKKFCVERRRKIIIGTFIVGVMFVLYWLHTSGCENVITKFLTPFFNMISWLFNQNFFTLPLQWIPLTLVIFILVFIILMLLLWPYVVVGISFLALIKKTLWNKRLKKRRIIKSAWTCFFVYSFVLWFAMANNSINWLPGKTQAEFVLCKKANPWAERYTPTAAKKAIGIQIAKYVQTKYGIDVTIDAARKQGNLWQWTKVIWGGVKLFFWRGLL